MEDEAPPENASKERGQPHHTQEELEELIAQHTRELEMTNIWFQASEERYRTLFEDSLQGIVVIVGEPYHIALSNPAANSILGYTSDEIANLTPDEFIAMIHWTNRQIFLNNLENLRTEVNKSLRVDARFNRADGKVILLDLSMTKLKNGEELSIHTAFNDITKDRGVVADFINSNRDLKI